MSAIILNVVGNQAPVFALTCQRNGAAIDLTAATIGLYITDGQTGDQTNTGHESCAIVSATDGTISYQPETGDFPNNGRFRGEIKITYSGGKVERLNELINIVVRDKTV